MYVDPERNTSYCSYIEKAIKDVEYVFNGRRYRREGCSLGKCTECHARLYKLKYARKLKGGKKQNGEI
jgi:hypothetical protein